MLTPDVIQLFCEKILGIPFLLNAYELNELIFPTRKYRIIGCYGKGANGVIFQIESLERNMVYALKTVSRKDFRSDEHAVREFQVQKEFAKFNMAPQVHSMEIRNVVVRGLPVQFVQVIMDPIYSTLYQFMIRNQENRKELISALLCLIRKKFLLKYPKPFLHSDMHFNNIVVLKDKKTLGFIDFGFSDQKPALLQVLDAIPLVASLKDVASKSDPKLKKYFEAFVHDVIRLFDKFFNIHFELNRFELIPNVGYQYRPSKDISLHSYNWVPNPKQDRPPLPTEEDIRKVFPTIMLPRVQ